MGNAAYNASAHWKLSQVVRHHHLLSPLLFLQQRQLTKHDRRSRTSPGLTDSSMDWSEAQAFLASTRTPAR